MGCIGVQELQHLFKTDPLQCRGQVTKGANVLLKELLCISKLIVYWSKNIIVLVHRQLFARNENNLLLGHRHPLIPTNGWQHKAAQVLLLSYKEDDTTHLSCAKTQPFDTDTDAWRLIQFHSKSRFGKNSSTFLPLLSFFFRV